MCGIAGWVSFDGCLDVDDRSRPTIEAMTATMVSRGPDAGGLWIDPHVALGHRRLAVIDLDGGAQPMVADVHGRVAAVTTYSGEIYNYRELRAELASRGHQFRTQSDTEVLLRAYLHWGTAFTERLNGMYAFALWDPSSQELLLVRDRLGIKPLFYYPTGTGAVFGSEPKAVLAHPEVRRVVDAHGLAELLSIAMTPGHGIYRGMHQVKPGHLVRLRREGLTEHRYWELESHDHPDDLATTIESVRELLDDTVVRQLVADVPVGTLLSGGLDSSTITSLAARHSRDPVRSFAVDFVARGDRFDADDLRATPDGPFAQLLADHVGSDHTPITFDSTALADAVHHQAVQTARDLPLGVGEVDTSLYLLFSAIKNHTTVALSGEAADELFGGYPWFHHGAAAAETFPWTDLFRRRGFSGNGEPGDRFSLLDRSVLETIDLEAYRAERYHEALGEVPLLAGESPDDRRMREISYLHLTRFVQFWLDRKDRLSMATGLEVRVPFCDHRLVEYVFNIPWAMKSFDGREKSLLRAAASDLLPTPILDRVKSPYPSNRDHRYTDALRGLLRSALEDPAQPVHDLVDATRADAALRAHGDDYRHSIEVALSVNDWVHRARPELDL
jgi:asparagine synthase (glutamine-hydrolysing)